MPAVIAMPSSVFKAQAKAKKVNPVVLEGICRYESGNGRVKHHHNKNGTWDVGFCQNHRYSTKDTAPAIPTNEESVKEAAVELSYWAKQHERFCVKMVEETGECGFQGAKKWIGVKNCKKPHPWWSHYNHGFRVLNNDYAQKVQCFIDNNFKKCKKNQWTTISF